MTRSSYMYSQQRGRPEPDLDTLSEDSTAGIYDRKSKGARKDLTFPGIACYTLVLRC